MAVPAAIRLALRIRPPPRHEQGRYVPAPRGRSRGAREPSLPGEHERPRDALRARRRRVGGHRLRAAHPRGARDARAARDRAHRAAPGGPSQAARRLRSQARLRPRPRRDARDDARHRGARGSRPAPPGDEHPLPVRALAARIRADEARVLRVDLRPARVRAHPGERLPRARADSGRMARLGEDLRAPELRRAAGAAIRALPEASRVPRHRRDHRGHDHEHPRGDGHSPHVGLPVLLAAGHGVRGRGPAAPRAPERGRAVPQLPARRGRERTAPAPLRHRRRAKPDRRALARTWPASATTVG